VDTKNSSTEHITAFRDGRHVISLHRRHTALSFNGCAVTGIWFGTFGEWITRWNATVDMKHLYMALLYAETRSVDCSRCGTAVPATHVPAVLSSTQNTAFGEDPQKNNPRPNMLTLSIFRPILLMQGLLYRPILPGVLTEVLLTRLAFRRVAADVSNDHRPSSQWTPSPRRAPLRYVTTGDTAQTWIFNLPFVPTSSLHNDLPTQ